MTALLPMILAALLAGALVSLSRALNGRLALATSPLVSSFWNHAVGAAALFLLCIALGTLVPDGVAGAPWWAWAGGTAGVVFIALGSWLVPRLGAALTATLVIGGHMVSGVILDILRGAEGAPLARGAGVVLILAGVWLAQRTRPQDQPRTR